MDVIYVGSGKSARLIKTINKKKYTIICANNAWRLFKENEEFDYWIHSGDFPRENFPLKKNFKTEISYSQYQPAIENLINQKLNLNQKFPHHYVGYTIFFQGLYWIFEMLKPSNIYLLGFDHDYNKDKTKKWFENGQPNPQNSFLKKQNETIKEWSKKFFQDFDEDFFYGHGTPDPLRLGENHLAEKFNLASEISKKLNINIYNASPIESNINKFSKIILPSID
jgi:hypothetical protein